jgi:hypothetical protein
MEKSQGKLTRAISYLAQQHAAAAEHYIGNFYLTFHQSMHAGRQTAEGQNLGAILITQRQQK